jgi:hypothetical protein
MQWQLGTWEPLQHLLEDKENQENQPVFRWPVAGPSGCIPKSSQQCGNQTDKIP